MSRVLSMVILLRILRLSDLLHELTVWNNMIAALRALAVPFFNLGVTLYYVYMVYATFGVRWYGGLISTLNIQ